MVKIPKLLIEVTDFIPADDGPKPMYWSMNLRTACEDGLDLLTPITIMRSSVRKYDVESIVCEALKRAIPGQMLLAMQAVKETPNYYDILEKQLKAEADV